MSCGTIKKIFLFFCFGVLLPFLSAAAEKLPELPGAGEASAILLEEKELVSYQRDGTAERSDEFRVLIRNDKGLREYRQLTLGFSEDYEKLSLEQLEIRKPDGKILRPDPARVSRITTASSDMGARIFDPSHKILEVTVPGIAVGDELFFRFREILFKPRYPGNWCGISVFQGEIPILRCQYTVDAPAEKPLKKIVVKNEVPGTLHFSETKQGDRIRYVWTAEKVPPVTPEPGMPALWRCSQRISVSTVNEWETISRWYCDLCQKPISAVTPAIRAKVAELTAGKKTPEEKMRALFQFVSQKISYVGLTEETVSPGYEPHPVSRTFERQNGVCRDKAALLVAMLREAGFSAHMVLFMAGDRKDEEVPNFYFNHAIAAVETGKGEYLLMDPTDETTKEFLPAYDRNRSFLVAREQGDTLRRSPASAAEENLLRIRGEGVWSEEGIFTFSLTMDFSGLYDVVYRSFLAGISPEKAREFFSSGLQELIPASRLLSLEITPEDRQNTAVPLRIQIKIRKEGHPAPFADIMPVLTPEFSRVFGLREKLLDLSLGRRRFPLKTPPFVIRENHSLRVPASLRIFALPAEQKTDIPGCFQQERKFAFADSTLHWENRFSIHTDEISPDEYARIKQSFTDRHSGVNTLPLGKIRFSGDENKVTKEHFPNRDSVLLSESKEIFLSEERGSWEEITKVSRKLFTYAAASDFSTLAIPYFPGYDSVEITGETVTPAGEVIPLSPSEIREMDAPGNGKTGQYPAKKLKIAVFSKVTPGSGIRYTVRLKRSRRRGFYTQLTAGAHDPVLRRELTVHAPQKKNVHLLADNHLFNPVWKTKDGTATLFLSLSSLFPTPQENSQPPCEDFLPAFRLSDFDYRRYAESLDSGLREKVHRDQPEIRKLAQKLTASAKNDREKVIALRDYVSRSVASCGPALNEAPLNCFHTPMETLAYGSGNSADRAILLAALCEAAGVPWRFFAVSEETALPKTKERLLRVPRDVFEGVLVYLPEQRSYLNDTGNFADLGATAHEGKIALELSSGHLTAIQPKIEFKSREKRNFSIRIRPDGEAKIEVRIRFYGNKAESFRAFFATANPLEKEQFAEKLSFSQCPGARLRSHKAKMESYPAEFSMEYDVPHFLSRLGNYWSGTLPGFSDYAASIRSSDRKRSTPYRRNAPLDLQQEYTIDFPKEFRPLPQRGNQTEIGRINTAFYRERFQTAAKSTSLQTRLRLPALEIPPEEYSLIETLNTYFAKITNSLILFQQGE